jgi:hypothetical protein
VIRWLGFIDFGIGSVTTAPAPGPNMAWPMRGRKIRVYPPRIRNEYWVEPGHVETDDPATDTREV